MLVFDEPAAPTSKGDDSAAERPTLGIQPDSETPETIYNTAVQCYQDGEFQAAGELFLRVVQMGFYRLQAAYAAAVCCRRLGSNSQHLLGVDANSQIGEAVYLACNLVCYLHQHGLTAHLTDLGPSTQLALREPRSGDFYLIAIGPAGADASPDCRAWRLDGDRCSEILLVEADTPVSAADLLIQDLLLLAPELPPYPLPPGGLPLSARS